jgi:nucleoside triphosphate pyrophosphatase
VSVPAAVAPILLASASPRRRALFGHLGYPFEAVAVDMDESPLPGETVRKTVLRLARAKAAAARAAHPEHAEAVVVGADTVVEVGGEVFGKPRDVAEARSMLARLAGREHRVLTAVAVLGPGALEDAAVEVTRVWFRPMTAAEITAYVATGEPMDKAGAYGIQERGAVYVERIEGDYFAVVGLPLCRLGQMLAKAVGPPPA